MEREQEKARWSMERDEQFHLDRERWRDEIHWLDVIFGVGVAVALGLVALKALAA